MPKILPLLLMGAVALTLDAAPRQLISVTDGLEAYAYEYDTDGKLVKVSSKESVFTFDYSQLASKKFVMTRVDSYYGKTETTVTNMTLNDAGLVVKAEEIENGRPEDTYFTFEYTDGYLTSYKQIDPKETEETRITYADGKITKVENIDGSNPRENETVTFDYDGIMNPGELVVFDNIFSVDLDDMEYVAMTGMLGKIYSQLPVKITETSAEGTEVETVKWTVDDSGYVTGAVISDRWSTETYSYKWSDVSAITTVTADSVAAASEYFTIDGKRASADTKGLVIERRADGTSVKRINR